MSVQDDAIKILDGIEEIARNQMLVRGLYITDEVVRPDLAEAHSICGGRQACMVGSMWIAAGFVSWQEGGDNCLIPELPGVTTERLPDGTTYSEEYEGSTRTAAFSAAGRRDLALAYQTMNSVCADHPKWDEKSNPMNAMEILFEAQDENYQPILTDDDLFAILDTARERIRGMVVA
jgi:hypothetical protein